MNATITIELPAETKTTLNSAAKEEGISENDYAAKALRDYLFLRSFRKLSDRMIAESERSYCDEEIFAS